MTFRRYVGHAINVQSACPTNLIFDVGSGTPASATLTFSTTTLLKSSLSDNVWIVEPIAYTLPIATTRGGSPANNLQRYEICFCSSSSSSSSSSSAQLHVFHPTMLDSFPISHFNMAHSIINSITS